MQAPSFSASGSSFRAVADVYSRFFASFQPIQPWMDRQLVFALQCWLCWLWRAQDEHRQSFSAQRRHHAHKERYATHFVHLPTDLPEKSTQHLPCLNAKIPPRGQDLPLLEIAKYQISSTAPKIYAANWLCNHIRGDTAVSDPNGT